MIRQCLAAALSLLFLFSFFGGPAHAQISLDLGGVNGGGVRIGTSATGCAAGVAGSVRYNTTSKCLELCDGTSWSCISVAACGDATPNAFSFPDLLNQATTALVTSSIVQISGISCVVNVAVSGEGSPQLRTCGDATCSTVLIDWAGSGTIDNNQYLQLRLTTSATGGDTHTATVAVGTAAAVWNATPVGDCSGTPVPGTVCADGTVYAGLTPDGNVKMYTTRCDGGRTWDGMACLGGRVSLSWNHGESSGYVDAAAAASVADGAANTAILVPLDANNALPGHQNHMGAVYCASLNQNGHTDWYLPATGELAVMAANANGIGDFLVADNIYLPSNQSGNAHFQAVGIPSGSLYPADTKNSARRVRCVRK